MSRVSRPGRLARNFMASNASLCRHLDDNPELVVDGLPLDCTAECGQRVGACDLEVQPGRIPVVALGHLGRGSGDRGVAPRPDVKRVEVLGDSTVEVAERQRGTADQSDPRNLAGIP